MPGVASITDLDEAHVASIADAFVRILKGYDDIGVGSFNVASFSAHQHFSAAEAADAAKEFTLCFKVGGVASPA